MILLYPLLLLAAGFAMWRLGRRSDRGRGWRWFAAWSVAGALMTFSFITGFSIGLFVLPFAAAALLWVAGRAPGLAEASGFLAGAGAVLVLVAFGNDGGFDPRPWWLAGSILLVSALLAFVARSAAQSGER